jgi:hypothetical protein
MLIELVLSAMSGLRESLKERLLAARQQSN